MDETHKLDKLLTNMPVTKQCTICLIVKGEACGWLTVLPQQADRYDMMLPSSVTSWRSNTTVKSQGFLLFVMAVVFSLQHGLDCTKGGLVNKGHT